MLEFGPLATGGSAVNSNNLAAGTRFQAITFLPSAPAYQLTGSSISLGGNVLNLSSSNQTINLALALVASGISFNTGAAGLSVSGAVSGTGGITKLGSGELILSASNRYTGGTNLADGTLVVANSAALGPSGSLVFSGGTLQYSGISTDFSSRVSPVAANQAVAINTGGEVVSFASAISGSGSLVKLGAGELILAGSDAYTGGTYVWEGTLAIDGKSAIPSGSLTVGDDASLLFAEPAQTVAAGTVADQGSATVLPVPEPGTALLAIAAGLAVALKWLLRKSGSRPGLS